MQHKDTGAYWCAVETILMNVKEQFHLTVQSAPDVSVVSSSVSGHQSGDISVQCLYSSGYQKKLKQWCRYKDQRCYTENRRLLFSSQSLIHRFLFSSSLNQHQVIQTLTGDYDIKS
ncbi:hypothetical protein QQF64_015613 [Cirrhinus molitorella]|uniref:Immunoglobulin V-set domain-containing protein n=1 Tax=Cirrhinus molitorella TaxID=172907 RepID=A0ABR3NVE4_9TELE